MYIIDCYFSRMVTLNTQQHLKDWLLIVFCYFTFFDLIVFFLVFSFQTLMYKETSRLLSILHIVYFESFCYVMYYIVLEICIGIWHFLEDCFYFYFQQINSAVANESLIPYNLLKKASYFFWIENWYLLTWNLVHILSNLKTFKEAIKTFWMWCDIFYWSHYISALSADNLPFTCFC